LNKTILSLDDVLCEQFQFISNFIQDKFGIRCFTCARIFLFISIVCGLAGYKHWIKYSIVLLAAITLYISLSFIAGMYKIFEIERMFDRNSCYVNPERINYSAERVALFFFHFAH
jgi:hypothetical protein